MLVIVDEIDTNCIIVEHIKKIRYKPLTSKLALCIKEYIPKAKVCATLLQEAHNIIYSQFIYAKKNINDIVIIGSTYRELKEKLAPYKDDIFIVDTINISSTYIMIKMNHINDINLSESTKTYFRKYYIDLILNRDDNI